MTDFAWKRIVWLLAFFLVLGTTAIAADFETVITDQLIGTYDLQPPHYQIEITSNSLSTRIVDPADLSWRPVTNRDALGSFSIIAEIRDGDELIDRGQIRFRIARFDSVLTVQHPIRKHELLTEGSVAMQWAETTNLRSTPVEVDQPLEHHRTTQSLRQGETLTLDAIETIPDINMGDDITIVYSDGACTITVPGRAMEAGWTGAQLRVRNETSGKVITATVIDKMSVAVRP